MPDYYFLWVLPRAPTTSFSTQIPQYYLLQTQYLFFPLSLINLFLNFPPTTVCTLMHKPNPKHINNNYIILLTTHQMDFETVFDKLARFNNKNRCIILIFTLSTTILLGLGLLNIRLETDPQSLWVSHSSQGYK